MPQFSEEIVPPPASYDEEKLCSIVKNMIFLMICMGVY